MTLNMQYIARVITTRPLEYDPLSKTVDVIRFQPFHRYHLTIT